MHRIETPPTDGGARQTFRLPCLRPAIDAAPSATRRVITVGRLSLCHDVVDVRATRFGNCVSRLSSLVYESTEEYKYSADNEEKLVFLEKTKILY